MKYSVCNIQTAVYLTLIIMTLSLEKATITLDLDDDVMPTDLLIQTIIFKNMLKSKIKENLENGYPLNSETHDTNLSPSNTTDQALEKKINPQNHDTKSVNKAYKMQDQKFFYIDKIECTDLNCQAPNYCEDSATCICGEGRANFNPSNEKSSQYCDYYQKKQLNAFMTETFTSNGFGHFYAGRHLFGFFKILALYSAVFFGLLLNCTNLVKKEKITSSCLGLFLTLTYWSFLVGAILWQFIDMIMYGMNNYKDGNGIPLKHW